MRYFTRELYNLCQDYKNVDSVKESEKKIKRYHEYQKKVMNLYDANIIDWFRFHDCTIGFYNIFNMIDGTTTLSVSINNSGGFTAISRIEFIDVKEHNLNDKFIGDWLLYSEVHKIKDDFEFLYLTIKEELRIVCKDIRYFTEELKEYN